MLRKSLVALLAVMLFGAAFATPARAQSQAVSFNIGKFFLRGEDARLANNDILATELNAGFIDALAFNLKDFNNVTIGGEWLIGMGDFLEGGIGVAYYNSGGVPSVSRNYVNKDNTEITQTLRLRIVPITATVRFLPLGRTSVVEPYVGAGVGIFPWRYSEVGQFVASDESIFTANYAATGTNVGPVVLGGLRIPFGAYAVGGEVRWQRAKGTLPTDQFLSDTIDLGGISGSFNFTVRFGGR